MFPRRTRLRATRPVARTHRRDRGFKTIPGGQDMSLCLAQRFSFYLTKIVSRCLNSGLFHAATRGTTVAPRPVGVWDSHSGHRPVLAQAKTVQTFPLHRKVVPALEELLQAVAENTEAPQLLRPFNWRQPMCDKYRISLAERPRSEEPCVS